jgi:LPS sulfotransferase NodH
MQMSEYPKIEHEPFNVDRKLGYVIQKFRKNEAIDEDLKEIFTPTPLIKHCYELFGKEFNFQIVDAAKEHPYKHIFLKREDEISRIFSLFMAMQTQVWGPEKQSNYQKILGGEMELEPFDIDQMIRHMQQCRQITHEIKEKLSEENLGYHEVSFEEFYSGTREERLAHLAALFDYLEFDSNVMERYADLIEEKIFNSSQNTQSVLEYVPNYREALERLKEVSVKIEL